MQATCHISLRRTYPETRPRGIDRTAIRCLTARMTLPSMKLRCYLVTLTPSIERPFRKGQANPRSSVVPSSFTECSFATFALSFQQSHCTSPQFRRGPQRVQKSALLSPPPFPAHPLPHSLHPTSSLILPQSQPHPHSISPQQYQRKQSQLTHPMARFGVLVAAVAGALLAVVSAGTTNATPDREFQCYA